MIASSIPQVTEESSRAKASSKSQVGTFNYKTNIDVLLNGDKVKVVRNHWATFGLDVKSVRSSIQSAIYRSPTDTRYRILSLTYDIEKQMYSDEDLALLREKLFAYVLKKADIVVNIKVNVEEELAQDSRSLSRMRVNNENSNDGNRIPPSPILIAPKRYTTPTNTRTPSRGRFSVATTSKVPVTPAPATIRVPSSPPTSTIKVMPPAPPAAENRKTSVTQVAGDVGKSIIGNSDTFELAANDMMPPPSSQKKVRRLTQADLETENHVKTVTAIEKTWQDVSGSPGGDPSSKLSEFNYKSMSPLDMKAAETILEIPLPESAKEDEEGDDEDYHSCNGDIGEGTEDLLTKSDEVPEQPEVDVAQAENPFASTPPKSVIEVATEVPHSATKDKLSNSVSTVTPKKKPSVPSHVVKKSATKPKLAVSAESDGVVRPVYPDGRTLAENSLAFEQSFRSYRGNTKTFNTPNKKTPSKSNVPSEFSPVHSKNISADGRPSIGTMTQQWEFMRVNFYNNDEEELKWSMISKKAGAYEYAHKKHAQAEDRYFRSLYEIDFYSNMQETFTKTCKLSTLLSTLLGYHKDFMANNKDERILESIRSTHNELKTYLSQQGPLNTFLQPFSEKVKSEITILLAEVQESRIVQKVRFLQPIFMQEVGEIGNKHKKAMKESEASLELMEKWLKRETETEEYPKVMLQQEEDFLCKEYDANLEALQTMRSILPVNIQDISITELMQQCKAQGGLLSHELATELKNNKLLHWIVTHPDDIVTSNFLNGVQKSFFENVEILDIVELRAIVMILPQKFEFDQDGRKHEWRNRIIQRLKQFVMQFNGEKVKGAFDAATQCRSMVSLPPLKPDQLRRSIYYYKTKEVSDQKLKQFDDKLALLKKKKDLLAKAEVETKETKEEYDNVLKDMRDQDFINIYGTDKLASVKDLAKSEWSNADKRRKILVDEVNRLQKSIDSTPISRDEFVKMEEELCLFLSDKGFDWKEKGQAPQPISGVFPTGVVLEKRVTAAAKFMSAEEEALQRQLELSMLKAKSANIVSVVSTDEIEQPSKETISQGEGNAEIPHDSESSSGALATNNTTISNADAAFIEEIANNVMTTYQATPRKSILLTANKDMLSTLNKMFSTHTPTGPQTRSVSASRAASRRMSIAVTGSSAQGGAALFMDKEGETVKKDVSKQFQSKLLMRILGGGKTTTAADTDSIKETARPQLSFLDQIKAAKKGPSMGFMAELQSRMKGKDTNSSGATETTEAPTLAPATPAPESPKPQRLNVMAAMGAMAKPGLSLFDQIKSRRKTDEE